MYGEGSEDHLRPFYSPSFTAAQWSAEAVGVAEKLERLARSSRLDPVRLVTVGRLTPNKNQRLVVQAVAELGRRGCDATLDIVGGGESEAELRELIREFQIENRVRLLGHRDTEEVWAAYRRADLNVLATKFEGYGKVLLEGMVAGTVPICTRSPVSEQITGGGARGRTFASDDLESLVDTILDVAMSPPTLSSMIDEGRERTQRMTLEAFEADVAQLVAACGVEPVGGR